MELKPCPFCGSDEIVLGKGLFAVMCLGCGVITKYYNTEKEAIAAWNRRASDEV